MHSYLYIYILSYLPLIPYKMSQVSTNVTADKLYEEAFSIKYAWEHMLPKEVFEYHNLIFRECNAPVDLQMGTILPFVVSCLGPNTRGLFLTRACCLNLFWILVGALGAGKSQSRKRFISEPLEYVLANGRVQIPDFEISKFTRAGKPHVKYHINVILQFITSQ